MRGTEKIETFRSTLTGNGERLVPRWLELDFTYEVFDESFERQEVGFLSKSFASSFIVLNYVTPRSFASADIEKVNPFPYKFVIGIWERTIT